MPPGLWTWPCHYVLPLHQSHWWPFGNHIHPSEPPPLASLAALWVSSPAGGALPWAPKVSSGDLHPGLIILKCKSWILFLPLALSALPCLSSHPQVPPPCQVHCLATVRGQWILVERMHCCKFFLRKFSSSLETLISLAAHEDCHWFI